VIYFGLAEKRCKSAASVADPANRRRIVPYPTHLPGRLPGMRFENGFRL
jgi:hypothetical protein